MEEEMVNVPNVEKIPICKKSKSNIATQPLPASNKHVRNSSSRTVSKFKGVVTQQNGNWGAQIYANNQRTWLGTFKTEDEAATAYDSAAIKLRSTDAQRNFPWTITTAAERNFQSRYTTDAVVNMIRDNTYKSKFADFLMMYTQNPEMETKAHVNINENGGIIWKRVFQKQLTPSDVGKLNRLVIPKKYAVKYLPAIGEDIELEIKEKQKQKSEKKTGIISDMEVQLYDKFMRLWTFRYCYWSSSGSYVFSRGWNSFVTEFELKANDVVVFHLSDDNGKLSLIDVKREEGNGSVVSKDDGDESSEPKRPKRDSETKGFKLFGVQIS